MLDGKYEITSERELDTRTTLFAATAPDGTALQISWYDLGSDEEQAFETYRALLRKLQRAGYAAIYDLVSRPGAYYVAWRVPETLHPSASADLEALETLLQTHGRTLAEAQLGSESSSSAHIFGLPFSNTRRTSRGAAPSDSPDPLENPRLEAVDNPVDNLWITLPKTFWHGFRPWALGSFFALVGVLLLLVSAQRTLKSDLVSVPEVRGQQLSPALETLYKQGFNTQAVALSSPQPTGTVIEVNPAVGTPLRPGRTVSVSYALSAGHAPVRVPGVRGTPTREASARLSEAGFAVGTVARVKHPTPRGTVIAQRPPAGARTARGGEVELLISDGPLPAQTFLPDLTDLGLSDALALAEAAGFARGAIHIERVPGSGVPDGTVLSQNLTPLLSVPQRAQLRLNVATGRNLSAADGGTPDLIGLGLAQAQLEARNVGLSVTATEEISTPLLPSGIVLQQPPPGTPLERSVEVTVNNPLRQTASGSRTGNVRRAEYRWLLEPEQLGKRATVTVTNRLRQTEVIVRGQRVQTGELSGTYLTTQDGPLTFRLTLGNAPYGEPLTVDP